MTICLMRYLWTILIMRWKPSIWNSLDYDNLKVIDKLISNQYDYNLLINLYTGDYSYIDDILSDPWKVSMSWSTERAITNLIHIYHMMDWGKELIMIEGC